MTGKYVGQRVARVNDDAPLHGTGEYLDDIALPGMLHAAIVRSPVAHGILEAFDAAGLPDGAAAIGPATIAAVAPGRIPVLWTVGDQDQRSTPVVDERLRYVGQPVGVVVAPSRYRAEDAAELVALGVDELEAAVTIDDALSPGAPLLYPGRGSNVLATLEAGDTAARTDAVFAAADHAASTTITIGRVHGVSMEPRGVVAVPGPRRTVTVYTSTQNVHAVRDTLCQVLALRHRDVRIVAPDVGGGFGLKDHVYEDEIMVVVAALQLGRPVKWVEDRHESFVATTHARDEVHRVEVAFDTDGTLRALRVDASRNAGARLTQVGGGPLLTAFGSMPGPYRWESVSCRGRLVATNTMSTGAYRGFGQTQAAIVRERAVELVAAALGRDPVGLRTQNLIGPAELPYRTRTLHEYDNGDYPAALRRAAALIAEPAPPLDGRARGVGFCCYVQMAGIGNSDTNELVGLDIGGFEGADVLVEPDGTVRVATGTSPHGQGLETTIAQLVADELGVPIDRVELVWGDTETAPYSAYGTAASRSITVGGGAAVTASRQVAAKVRQIAAEMLEAAPADIELAGGRATVVGTNVSVPFEAVASRAWQGFRLPDGVEPGLQASCTYDPPGATYSYATHACRVAVDPATGEVEVEDYVVVHDCGTIVNPTIVEGQIHGGVAQGLGAALLEELCYDPRGQPQTATMLDYHLPVSASVPDVRIEHLETPSPFTPGGMKGMGEGGTNGAYAAVVNAVIAALPAADWSALQTPLTPARVWEALRRGGQRRATASRSPGGGPASGRLPAR